MVKQRAATRIGARKPWGGSMVCVYGDKTMEFESARTIDLVSQDLSGILSQKGWDSHTYNQEIDSVDTAITSFSDWKQGWMVRVIPSSAEQDSNNIQYLISLQYFGCCEWCVIRQKQLTSEPTR